MTPEDVHAKRQYIAAFFDDLKAKSEFLVELHTSSRRDEAWILCSVYIDRLGNALSASPTFTSRNFATVLLERGGEPVLDLVLPGRLLSELRSNEKRLKRMPDGAMVRVCVALDNLTSDVAWTRDELRGHLAPVLSSHDLSWLEGELWRGSLASVVYEHIRCPNVHEFGSGDGLCFSKARHNGHPIPDVDLWMLHRALQRIIGYARSLSETTNKLFGH